MYCESSAFDLKDEYLALEDSILSLVNEALMLSITRIKAYSMFSADILYKGKMISCDV